MKNNVFTARLSHCVIGEERWRGKIKNGETEVTEKNKKINYKLKITVVDTCVIPNRN